MIKVYRYTEEVHQDWDNMVVRSINGNFQHFRNYMEYHNQLFSDHSIMVEWEGTLACIVPAHEVGNVLYSHQGLSFGGFLLYPKLRYSQIYLIISAILEYAYNLGYESIIVKNIPSIYTNSPQGILEHAYFILEAELIGREFISAIPLPMDIETWEHGKRWGLSKSQRLGVRIEENFTFDNFWEKVLIPNLQTKFKAAPVHNVEEISRLATNNKGHIRQFNAYIGSELIAGITIFESEQLVRTQYISATPKGKSLHALDLMIYHLATEVFSHKKYIDLGTSHELQGRNIKHSLLKWKESYGALPYVQDTNKISTSAYLKLKDV